LVIAFELQLRSSSRSAPRLCKAATSDASVILHEPSGCALQRVVHCVAACCTTLQHVAAVVILYEPSDCVLPFPLSPRVLQLRLAYVHSQKRPQARRRKRASPTVHNGRKERRCSTAWAGGQRGRTSEGP
jgi:hypothetical protein